MADRPNKDNPEKIVPLAQRQAQKTGPEVGELLKKCLKTAYRRLESRIAALFENLDDALFDMAEKADSNALQTKYFDGMREVRKSRQRCERLFKEAISDAFKKYSRNELKAPANDSSNQESDELSIVEDQELEERLAVSNLVAKVNNHAGRELYALNQRLSVLAGGIDVTDDTNPVGMTQICEAFRVAQEALNVELPVKLFVYKLFDKIVGASMLGLYKELNAQLAGSGVLPSLKPQFRRAGPAGGGYSAAPATGAYAESEQEAPGAQDFEQGGVAEQYGPAPAPGGAPMPPVDPNQLRYFQGLRRLLAVNRGQSSANIAGEIDAGYAYQGSEAAPSNTAGYDDLMNALSLLQSDLQQANQSSQQQLVDRSRIMSQLNKLGTDNSNVSANDSDTIDLVGMVFDFILNDRNIAPPIRATLSRLQIPYLKVALLDRHLFAQKSHPARKLLDELAHAGIGWSDETDKDNKLLEKIETTVDALLNDFDDNVEIFSELLESFQAFHKKLTRRTQATEKRTTEASKGKERLQNARKTAAKQILSRLERTEEELPALIVDLLKRPWANVLVLLQLRHGEESEAYRDALDTADLLLWSGLPKKSEKGYKKLLTVRPELEESLRSGLELVAYHQADIDKIVGKLDRCHRDIIKAFAETQAPPPLEAPQSAASTAAETEQTNISESNSDDTVAQIVATQPAAPIDDELAQDVAKAIEIIESSEHLEAAEEDEQETVQQTGLPDQSQDPFENFVEEIVMTSDEESEPEVESQEDEFLAQVDKLEAGTWVEFSNESGETSRAKLSWISPISQNYLFVNRKGLKIADKTRFGLAAEMRRGDARIIQDVPLFDRAMGAIVNKLKSGSATPNTESEKAPVQEKPESSDDATQE